MYGYLVASGLQGTIAANTNDEITTLEVEAVIERYRNGKATGNDCIPNEIYKAGSVRTVKDLTMIFNTSYKTGRIPQEWGISGQEQARHGGQFDFFC